MKQAPSPRLAPFVEYYWVLSDAPAHRRERILPTGRLELVINLHDDRIRIYDDGGVCRRFSGAVLSGAYGRSFVIDTAEHALAIGVHFHPAGALPFLHTSPAELADDHFDLRDLWGTRAEQLCERLRRATTHSERFRILEQSLVAAVRARRGRSELVPFALNCNRVAGSTVAQIVARAGVSHRHFTSVFREEVGMTPKLFFRIERFQRTITLARGRAPAGWAALAAECGYYDQAHMIRDFAAFARTTPAEYLRRSCGAVKDHHLALASALA